MKNLLHDINDALSRTVCQGWDRNFLQAMHARLVELNPPTPRQEEVIHRVIDRCGESQEARHIEWAHEYKSEHKKSAIILAHYHVRKSYFNDIAEIILANEIPTRRKFMRMLNNKYSQKIIREYHKEPRLALGAHVGPRASFNGYAHVVSRFSANWNYEHERAAVARFEKYGAFVVGTEEYVHSPARGAKRYRLLAPGTVHVFIVEERFLKIMKG